MCPVLMACFAESLDAQILSKALEHSYKNLQKMVNKWP
jgi:hypothetical protein